MTFCIFGEGLNKKGKEIPVKQIKFTCKDFFTCSWLALTEQLFSSWPDSVQPVQFFFFGLNRSPSPTFRTVQKCPRHPGAGEIRDHNFLKTTEICVKNSVHQRK